jgi:hypothetical protein
MKIDEYITCLTNQIDILNKQIADLTRQLAEKDKRILALRAEFDAGMKENAAQAAEIERLRGLLTGYGEWIDVEFNLAIPRNLLGDALEKGLSLRYRVDVPYSKEVAALLEPK